MSRIIVKGLPKEVTEHEIRSHFSEHGQISDVKLLRTDTGKSRRFAYVGFRSDQEATSAIRHFNNSFFRSCKLTVEAALSKSDSSLPKPWSKHSQANKPSQQPQDKPQIEPQPKKIDLQERKKKLLGLFTDRSPEEQLQLQQYLEAVKPKTKIRAWENDAIPNVVVETVLDKRSSGRGEAVAKSHVTFQDQDDSDSEYQDLATSPPVLESGSSDEEVSPPTAEPPQEKGDFSTIAESGRLFVRNLSFDCSEKDLEELFSQFGPLASVQIPISRETKRNKGFAFVLFVLPEHAVVAFERLDGVVFQGRLLHLLPGQDAVSAEPKEGAEPKSFKKKRDEKTRASAGNDGNWNSLFLNQNAVAEAIALEFGITKAQVFDPSAPDLAVRIALAETKIIAATKAFLETEGVALGAFASDVRTKKERSREILLVKNLPPETSISELGQLFGRWGTVLRLIMPPTKVVAIVEYSKEAEAKGAFRNLAYSRFHSVPLFLEWAPTGLLKPKAVLAAKEQEQEPVEPPLLPTLGASVYVKNIAFSTTNENLLAVFKEISSALSAKIATRVGSKGEKLSLGFGFVQFSSVESAKRAIDLLQGTVLDEHALQLKLARSNSFQEKAGQAAATSSAGSPCTKLLVRNIPFEASQEEIKTLFKSFAHVKKVRLPRKGDGSHRGFGFIEFLTKSDAQQAFTALCHTHLYGRHLVIEWAQENESVDQMKVQAKRRLDRMQLAGDGLSSGEKRSLQDQMSETEEASLDEKEIY